MEDNKVILNVISVACLFFFTLLIGGCNYVRKTEIMLYESIYKPGDNIIDSYENIEREYNCNRNSSVFLEDSSFRPINVAPGEKLFNRLVYASCHPTGLKGVILRRVIHKGNKIFEDRTNYEFMPGKWAVTAYITIPHDVEPGAYIFEFELRPRTEVIKKTFTFQVTPPSQRI